MLARRSLARAVAQPAAFGTAPTNARNMATLREIELRLKSVRNIEKITKVRRGFFFSFKCWTNNYFFVVDENDCFYQTFESSEGYAIRKGLWCR